MRILIYAGRSTVNLCACAALLASCNASQVQIATNPPDAGSAMKAAHGESWFAPGSAKGDLLYVSDEGADAVYVYSYPHGSLIKKLTGFVKPGGLCADKSGNVFITNTNQETILEYAHGGAAPIATLKDPSGYPVDCSVDPVTGNLAVASSCEVKGTGCGGLGSVSIYKNATGEPKTYSDQHLPRLWFCGYDGSGNLYVDGTGRHVGFGFAELPKGGTSLVNVRLHWSPHYAKITDPGGIQWDGKYVDVGQSSNEISGPSIYLTTGESGKIIGAVQLDDTNASALSQFWIQDDTLIAPDPNKKTVSFYSYPTGGQPTKKIRGFKFPVGATVSSP
jgi:hypothetical protein